MKKELRRSLFQNKTTCRQGFKVFMLLAIAAFLLFLNGCYHLKKHGSQNVLEPIFVLLLGSASVFFLIVFFSQEVLSVYS